MYSPMSLKAMFKNHDRQFSLLSPLPSGKSIPLILVSAGRNALARLYTQEHFRKLNKLILTIMLWLIKYDWYVYAVQSHDTNQAMQQERELWQQEKAALLRELEQLRRDVSSATPSRGTTSPPKSPSPIEEDPDLEISMTKVRKLKMRSGYVSSCFLLYAIIWSSMVC